MEGRRDTSLGVFLKKLSDEALFEVFSYLDVPDLLSSGNVTSMFYALATHQELWRAHCLRYYDGNGPLLYNGNWRWTALFHYYRQVENREVTERPSSPFNIPLLQLEGIYSTYLYGKWCRANMDLSSFEPPELADTQLLLAEHLYHSSGLKGESCSRKFAARFRCIGTEDFVNTFERMCRPALVCKYAQSVGWDCLQKWSLEYLALDKEYRYGISHPNAKKLRMTMHEYRQYMQQQTDELPLYIFDAEVLSENPHLMQDYRIPEYFPEDHFQLVGEKNRPPYQWIVIGPQRSGADWHVDPVGTSAWNVLVKGRKRWALYPPGVPPPGVKGAPSSLLWYLHVYPTLSPSMRPMEILQEAGDCVFIPGGWWHMVLNLDETISVTQNYVGNFNFPYVMDEVFGADEGMYHYFRSHVIEHLPSIASRLFQRDAYLAREGCKSSKDLRRMFHAYSSGGEKTGEGVESSSRMSDLLYAVALQSGVIDTSALGSICRFTEGENPVFGVDKHVIKFVGPTASVDASLKPTTRTEDEKHNPAVKDFVEPAITPFEMEKRLLEAMQKYGQRPLSSSVPTLVEAGFADRSSAAAVLCATDVADPETMFYHSGNWIWPYLIQTAFLSCTSLCSAMRSLDDECSDMSTSSGSSDSSDSGMSDREVGTQGVDQHALKECQPSQTGKNGSDEDSNHGQSSGDEEDSISLLDIGGGGTHLARQIAEILSQLHSREMLTTLQELPGGIPAARSDFGGYVRDRFRIVLQTFPYDAIGLSLRYDLYRFLTSFLDSFTAVSSTSAAVSIVHGDLNYDNLVGAFMESNDVLERTRKRGRDDHDISAAESGSEDGKWVAHGIVDWADARLAHPLYELPPFFVSALECRHDLLKVFMASYSPPHESVLNAPITPAEELYAGAMDAKELLGCRLMAMALIHPSVGGIFNSIRMMCGPHVLRSCETWRDVSRMVWNMQECV